MSLRFLDIAFKLSLENTVREEQINQEGLELKGIYSESALWQCC